MRSRYTYNMVLLCMLPAAICYAGCRKDSLPSGKFPALKDKLVSIVETSHLPTLSAYIIAGKDTLHFNYKNKDRGIQPVTRYGIASATKMLSSLLVQTIAAERKIDLDAPAGKYIDLTPLAKIPWADSITIRQLLNHTSGIPDYTQHPDWITGVMNGKPPASLAEKLKLIPAPDTSFQRGRFAYSNTNYVLLEQLVEALTGQKASVAFDMFFRQLGLQQLSLTPPTGTNQAFFSQSEKATSDVTAWEEHYGLEGGAYATPEDLIRLLRMAFVEKNVLPGPDFAQMMQWTDMNRFSVNFGYGQTKQYGLGLALLEVKGHQLIGHSGSSLRYQSFIFIEPATGVEIVLLTNGSGKHYNNAFFITIVGAIMQAIYGA